MVAEVNIIIRPKFKRVGVVYNGVFEWRALEGDRLRIFVRYYSGLSFKR